MFKIISFLTGYVTLRLYGSGALDALNTLKSEGFNIGSPSVTEDGYIISCSVFRADAVTARLMALSADFEVTGRHGISFFAYRYRARVGLLVGAALAMLIVFGSTRILWDVRIDCNGEYDAPAAERALASLGVKCGKPIGDIDVYNTELQFLVDNPQFSDIALNIQGTVAVVRLRVRSRPERPEEKTGAYDVVAAEPGIIRGISATEGVPVVKDGDTVDKGDVLISGIMQGAYGEYYIHHACGSVAATVYREFTAVIPLNSEKKIYTGKSETKTTFTVLGRQVRMFLSELSPFEKSDAETSTKPVTVFGLKTPIVKESVIYREYTVSPTRLSEEEAEREARAAFDAFLESEAGGEVTKTEVDCTYNEELDAVVISAVAEVIAEIGVETPIKDPPKI